MSDLSYKTIKSDYKYLASKYGANWDFCGGVCNADMYHEMMENPNEEMAIKHYLIHIDSIINGCVDSGSFLNDGKKPFEPDENDSRTRTIIKRYK
jgi:hypothetical protein